MPSRIEFDHMGIGTVLKRNRLAVPVNQREYAWKREHVEDLFQDFQDAVANGKTAYFLGTIVLTAGRTPTAMEVTDGQQRLATTTILLAAIRDYLDTRDDAKLIVRDVDQYLFDIDRNQNGMVPRLTLNVDDNEYFRIRILPPLDGVRKPVKPSKPSHENIDAAARVAAERVRLVTDGFSEHHKVAQLNRWIDFIEKNAQVIILKVPDDVNAFVMFETLNDRGVKTTQADMLKNYLLGQAEGRTPEAQQRWSAMKGALETGDADDVVVTYLRHFLVARHGATREKQVYEKIKAVIRGPNPTIQFLDELAESATVYAALTQHTHPYWRAYGALATKIRRHVETLNELNVEQIRPLMLACVARLTPADLEKSFRVFVSWSVRFMVSGAPTGNVEKYYAGRALEVWKGEIRTAAGLADAMLKYLPGDDAFRTTFATFRVSKSYLARYYLRSLERTLQDDPQPEWVVNDDETELNLEHILPEVPSAGWGHIRPVAAEGAYRRLGNLVLLKAKVNSKIGNGSFEEKRKAITPVATLETTKGVLKHEKWGLEEIDARQAELAQVATRTWPLTIR
ncbi:MAG TPA: DUF262 domain-containing HNH endonuclease family protein [Urbifossiella sp.]|nr:DUF262 domain-containing HNH endonuclease family protein [Urbifossiella sp.]